MDIRKCPYVQLTPDANKVTVNSVFEVDDHLATSAEGCSTGVALAMREKKKTYADVSNAWACLDG